MPQCALGLGGNLGDVRDCLRRALAQLQQEVGTVRRVSPVYRTTPVGPHAQAPFLNAAAIVETGRDPLSVLAGLHEIEGRLGRTRTTRWGPRTIDLDLLLYDQAQIHSDRIDVPHPGCLYRRFVLDPLADVAPDWRHPEAGLSIAALREWLLQRPLCLLVIGRGAAERRSVAADLAERFQDVRVTCREAAAAARSPVAWLAGDDTAAGPQLALNLDLLPAGDHDGPRQLVLAMLDEPQREGNLCPTID